MTDQTPPLQIAPSNGYVIGIDIGGTKVAAGLVDVEGRIVHRLRRDTSSKELGDVEDIVVEIARELSTAVDVRGIGVGAPGFVDESGSVVRFSANLGWRELPLRARIQEATGLTTAIENDGNAAAWGEFRFGAAAGESDMVFIGVGTGIGGGIVLAGEPYRGRFGLAGEFGHLRVVPDGLPCGCGRRGCWEQYASGSALVREARERARANPGAAQALLAFGDGTTRGIDGPSISRAATAGESMALDCFAEVGRWLGRGAAEVVALLDPGVVVIGGGVSESGELLMGPVRTTFEAALVGAAYRPMPAFRLASLGNDAGLVGAADLGRRVIESSR